MPVHLTQLLTPSPAPSAPCRSQGWQQAIRLLYLCSTGSEELTRAALSHVRGPRWVRIRNTASQRP